MALSMYCFINVRRHDACDGLVSQKVAKGFVQVRCECSCHFEEAGVGARLKPAAPAPPILAEAPPVRAGHRPGRGKRR